MNKQVNGTQAVIKMMCRLLPVQVLLASVGAVNGIISSFFASNYVGTDAMSAVGLYAPVNQLPVYLSMENRQKRTMAASLMHIGIKMVYKSTRNVEYQSVLGMNVLTLRI